MPRSATVPREGVPSLSVVAHPLDAGMACPMADNLRAIVREVGGHGLPGRSEREAKAVAWVGLSRPAWWRLEACWDGTAGSLSAQAARDIRDRYVWWRRNASLCGTGLAEGADERLSRKRDTSWWR